MNTDHFVYKLIPPRPTFASDQTEEEAAVMGQHAGYWAQRFDEGNVVAYGPVADPAGVWGLAIVSAQDEQEIHNLAKRDPAVTSGMATYAVYPMLVAHVRNAS